MNRKIVRWAFQATMVLCGIGAVWIGSNWKVAIGVWMLIWAHNLERHY